LLFYPKTGDFCLFWFLNIIFYANFTF